MVFHDLNLVTREIVRYRDVDASALPTERFHVCREALSDSRAIQKQSIRVGNRSNRQIYVAATFHGLFKPRTVLRGIALHIEFAKQKIYFLNFVGAEFPFAPSWCLRDKEFIVGLFPSHVKEVLLRGKDFKSLTTVKEVSTLVEGDGTYTAIGYQDTREMFKLAYPALQMFAQFLCSEAQRNRIDIDISALPSAATIAKHLEAGVTTVARKADGIEITSRQSAPLSVGSAAVIVPAMAIFWRSGGGRDEKRPDRAAPPRELEADLVPEARAPFRR